MRQARDLTAAAVFALLALVCLCAVLRGEGRTYHRVTIAELATTRWTHVETTGRVVYVRKQQDGDWHVTIVDSQERKAVLEIIPAIPLEVPRKGQVIRARGIARVDKHHAWGEIHPLEWWQASRE